jgi:tetratricopeptide (TPR) repeat protein
LSGKNPSLAFPLDEALPDVLHALGEVLGAELDYEPQSREAVESVYAFVEVQRGRFRDDDEWNRLCARFAYVGWAVSRRESDYVTMNRWEQVCERHVLSRCELREFLGLPIRDRDVGLIDRFLRSPEDVLAACRWQRYGANANPLLVSQFTIRVYEFWVSRFDGVVPSDERAYIAGELALSVARGYRLLEKAEDMASWVQIAKRCYGNSRTGDIGLCKLNLLGLQTLYDHYRYETILALVPRLVPDLERFGLHEELLRCRYLEALCLKGCGRLGSALDVLAALLKAPEVANDNLLYGLSMASTAEILAAQGKTREALGLLLTARPSIERSNVAWAMANYHGILAEVLRDSGRLNEAIDGYQAAVRLFSAAGIESKAAYITLLLAESLMLSGRGGEAVAKLVAVLPALERDSPTPAIATAVALLHESLRRQQADPDALRRLRLELQKMSERNQS